MLAISYAGATFQHTQITQTFISTEIFRQRTSRPFVINFTLPLNTVKRIADPEYVEFRSSETTRKIGRNLIHASYIFWTVGSSFASQNGYRILRFPGTVLKRKEPTVDFSKIISPKAKVTQEENLRSYTLRTDFAKDTMARQFRQNKYVILYPTRRTM